MSLKKIKEFLLKNNNVVKLCVMLILSFIITCISFCYANSVLDINMIMSYFEPLLFLLNFIPIFLMNKVFELCNYKGNKYMQYTNDLKEKVDVISNYYYKEDNEYIRKGDSKYLDKITEYNYINYYVSRNWEVNK